MPLGENAAIHGPKPRFRLQKLLLRYLNNSSRLTGVHLSVQVQVETKRRRSKDKATIKRSAGNVGEGIE